LRLLSQASLSFNLSSVFLATVGLDEAQYVIVKLPDLSWKIADYFKNIHWFCLFVRLLVCLFTCLLWVM